MQLLTPSNRSEMLDVIGLGGKDCAEIGVFRGEFSEEILRRAPKTLWLVDPWTSQPPSVYPSDHANLRDAEFDDVHKMVADKFAADERVRIVRGYSYFASLQFSNESLDFAYVDAVHTFESCLCDMLTWFHKVRQGGWLCGHDYTGKYVGVKAAVEAFGRITGRKLDLLTLEPWASWGIRK
jgi:hypothetical protein